MRSILFVCLGNTCRSPAAEGFARKFTRDTFPAEEYKELRIESAGLYHSFLKAQPQSIQYVQQTEGEDISGHASQVITDDMACHFDLIITMETYMKDVLAAQFSNIVDLPSKIITLKEICQEEMQLVKSAGFDIQDPYLMPDYVYFPVLEEIRQYTKYLVNKWFAARHGS